MCVFVYVCVSVCMCVYVYNSLRVTLTLTLHLARTPPQFTDATEQTTSDVASAETPAGVCVYVYAHVCV